MRDDIGSPVRATYLTPTELECLRLMLRCFFVHCVTAEVAGPRSPERLVAIADEYRAVDGVLEVAAATRPMVVTGKIELRLGPGSFRVLRDLASRRFCVEDAAIAVTIAAHRPRVVMALDAAVGAEGDTPTLNSIHAFSDMVN